MIGSLCISLFLTIVIESLLSIFIIIKNGENLFTIIWINFLTNPIVVYLTNLSRLLNNITISNIVLLILELFVIILEGYLLKKYLKDVKINSYILSIYLNFFSFSFGIILKCIL